MPVGDPVTLSWFPLIVLLAIITFTPLAKIPPPPLFTPATVATFRANVLSTMSSDAPALPW